MRVLKALVLYAGDSIQNDYRWVYMHQFNFLKALLFIMMDLTGEVSSGAVDMARQDRHCF